MHRDWWNRIGGYSSELSPGMSSDNDFSMKFWDAGCRIFIGVGDSLVYHFQQKSTGKIVKNDGRRQFLNKWGMTQATFDRHYLHRGEPADTRVALDTPAVAGSLKRARCARGSSARSADRAPKTTRKRALLRDTLRRSSRISRRARGAQTYASRIRPFDRFRCFRFPLPPRGA